MLCPRCLHVAPPGAASCARDGAALVDRVAGRFAVSRRSPLLARGLVAVDATTGDEVTLRVAERLTDPALIGALARWVAALATVRSPHVLRARALVHDARVGAVVVFDPLHGRSLADLRDRAPSPALARDWIAGALDGIAAAHAAGLIHGGLTAGDVVLVRDGDGDGERAVLVLDQPPRRDAMPGPHAAMAPELILDRAPASPAADVYALAAILYQLVAGRPPRDAATTAEWIALWRRGAPPPPLGRGLALDPLGAVLARALAVAPAARPTAAQLAPELRATPLDAPLTVEAVRARLLAAADAIPASRDVYYGRAVRRGLAAGLQVIRATPAEPDALAWIDAVLRGLAAARDAADREGDEDGFACGAITSVRHVVEALRDELLR